MTKLSSVRSLGKKRVAVRVRRIGGSNKYEVVPGSITMLSGEVKVGERDGALIVDENVEAMQPTGKFMFAAETIVSFHLVTYFF